MTRLFGSDPESHIDLSEGTTSYGMGYPNERKGVDEQVVNDSSVSLSISNSADYPGPNNTYSGLRADQVKDSGGAIHGPNEHVYYKGDRSVPLGQVFDGGNGTGFVSAGQGYKESDSNARLMGHMYYRGNARVETVDSTFDKGDVNNTISIDQCINHVDSKTVSFTGFQDGVDELARPVSNYNLFYNQCSVETSESAQAEELLVEISLSSVYDQIEQFYIGILSQLPLMDKNSDCPEECKENVASLMYAAARFSDLPELRGLRRLFTCK